MPTYLVHGFRWIRHSIRIHIIMQDLEDAAAEWIIAPTTSITLLNSFYTLFDFLPPSNPPPPVTYTLDVPPDNVVVEKKEEEQERVTAGRERSSSRSMRGLRRISSAMMLKGRKKEKVSREQEKNGKNAMEGEVADKQRPKTSATTSERTSLTTDGSGRATSKEVAFNDWSAVKLIEQYNPDDLETVTQPYAYVADHIINVTLCASISEEMAKYEANLKAEEDAVSGTATPVESTSEGDKSPTGSLAQERRAKRLRWIEKMRDGMEKDAEVGWFVVVCGDEERAVPDEASFSQVSASIEEEREDEQRVDTQKTPTRQTLKRFFSRPNLRQQA